LSVPLELSLYYPPSHDDQPLEPLCNSINKMKTAAW
jgi:hypothetical protein